MQIAVAEQNDEWVPDACPRCESDMQRVPGQKRDAWKCNVCGLEVWDNIPSSEEFYDLMHSSPREVYRESTIPLVTGKKGNKNKSGRRRKKKISFKWRKPLDT